MKKFRAVFYVFLFLALFGVVACYRSERGSGESASEFRQMEPFNKIYADGAATIVLIQSDQHSVRVESERNLLPLLSTAVINGQLTIQPLKEILPTKPIVYFVSFNKLEELHIAGAFDVLNETPLRFERFKVDISGLCRLKFDKLDGKLLDIKLTGASMMDVKGTVDSQNICLEGTSNYIAVDLVSKEADIQISGTGDAGLNVKNSLKIDISGTGEVIYQGSPVVSSDISGTGTVRKM